MNGLYTTGRWDYLEIGVRDPEDNYNRIKADTKYSVDPGIEFMENPVDFQMTSDEFSAYRYWNGTTWKAFLKWRCSPFIYSCCIDSDWGVGILSKGCRIGKNIDAVNPFFEFGLFKDNRKNYLNLIGFESFNETVRKRECMQFSKKNVNNPHL